nr:MAG: glycerol-3-phosphate ABC transporter ATP-binding protein [Bacillota bacterium]
MATLSLRNVVKRFGDHTVVKNFTLDIADGEFIVFVGPSGCGKSTTLRMIAGLEEITEGEIYIDGRLVNDVPPKDRDIAMVFQNYALYPHMNVYENMAFGLKLRKYPKHEIDRRVKEAAEILGLKDLLHRRPKELSGGQRQRVALGRAIVRNPKVFLMDEPLSNLDAKLRVQMRTELAKLHQRLQTTTIYVTHDQVEAMTMGDRIVVMKDGEIQQVAPPRELYEAPANLFVAGFIGSPAMNFLRGRLAEKEGELVFDAGTFTIPLPRHLQAAAREHGAREVILGVRPEHIEADPHFVQAHPEAAIRATIEVVEPLGAETFLYLRAGEHSLTARVEGTHAFRDGDTITVAPRIEKVHLFDPQTERAIREAPVAVA